MPARKISIPKLVEALRRSEKPVLDAKGLAAALDVTEQSIRRYSDELAGQEEVGTMEIGQTTVYWYIGPEADRTPLDGKGMVYALDEYGEDPEYPDDGVTELPTTPPPTDRGSDTVAEDPPVLGETAALWAVDFVLAAFFAAVLTAITKALPPNILAPSAVAFVGGLWITVAVLMIGLALFTLLVAIGSHYISGTPLIRPMQARIRHRLFVPARSRA